MDFFKAIEWVQNNEPTIRSKIWQYRKFTPYEVSDFLQEAYEAALVATLLSQEKDIPFEAAFWTTFRNRISSFLLQILISPTARTPSLPTCAPRTSTRLSCSVQAVVRA